MPRHLRLSVMRRRWISCGHWQTNSELAVSLWSIPTHVSRVRQAKVARCNHSRSLNRSQSCNTPAARPGVPRGPTSATPRYRPTSRNARRCCHRERTRRSSSLRRCIIPTRSRWGCCWRPIAAVRSRFCRATVPTTPCGRSKNTEYPCSRAARPCLSASWGTRISRPRISRPWRCAFPVHRRFRQRLCAAGRRRRIAKSAKDTDKAKRVRS